jgi:hypothetical protein
MGGMRSLLVLAIALADFHSLSVTKLFTLALSQPDFFADTDAIALTKSVTLADRRGQ